MCVGTAGAYCVCVSTCVIVVPCVRRSARRVGSLLQREDDDDDDHDDHVVELVVMLLELLCDVEACIDGALMPACAHFGHSKRRHFIELFGRFLTPTPPSATTLSR